MICKTICISKVSLHTIRQPFIIDDRYEVCLLNETEIITAYFLDISKCFATIDHDLLMP